MHEFYFINNILSFPKYRFSNKDERETKNFISIYEIFIVSTLVQR